LTEYVILSRTTDTTAPDVAWSDGGKKVTAASAKAAVAAHVKEHNLDKGIFVAIPARSFSPIRVKAEQKVKITFS
jgi:hypothetical protein